MAGAMQLPTPQDPWRRTRVRLPSRHHTPQPLQCQRLSCAADGGDLVRGAAPAPPPRARCLLSLHRAGEALRPSLPLSRWRDCSTAATARRAPAVAAALRPGDRPLFGRRRRQPGAALAGSCHLLHRPRCRCRRVAAASSASRRPRCCPRSLRLGQRGLILVSLNQMKAKLWISFV